jgi:pectate lyase
MKHSGFKAALCAAFLFASTLGHAADPVDAARQVAPADGWASQAGGTVGGSTATTANIYTVTNRAQLLAAILNAGTNSKIIKLVGTVDMSEGIPFLNTADQAARGTIRLKSNTTLIGDAANAGITNGQIVVSGVSQIIIRNLKLVNPCDVGPVFDQNDGALGNWNSAYDGIGISASDHVWIDHNSFTDLPVTDDFAPIEQGRHKQCHDGALDITNASDYVTVSYNSFGQHEKNNLVGSSDGATGDEGKLRVTFSNNVYRDIASRSPRVRFGQVHLFNNYYAGTKGAGIYPHDYSVGVGNSAKILSQNNVFEVGGASTCADVVKNFSTSTPAGAFKDTGSVLNGAAIKDCTVSNAVTWTPPYAFSVRPIALVKANAIAQAGGGKLVTAVTGTGVVVDTGPSLLCPANGFYFCDDFQAGTTSKWDLLPIAGANGAFSVVADAVGSANKVLQYGAASTGGILALAKAASLSGVPSGDYFIEARIRPMTNSTTGNKLLYLVTRYVDANNWYGAGLNVQPSTASTQVEIAKMLAGVLTRPKQVKKVINMDAQFYTVRFEMIGSTLTVYLDGEKLGFVTDTAFAARGLVGLYTANKSFQIDDVRIGNPALKPVQLTLNPGATTYAAEAGDTPLQVTVTAVAADNTVDSYTATSSDSSVATVSVNGTIATITPVGAGTANIVFTSGSDATLTRSIAATISPQFIQPTQGYTLDGGVAYPAPHTGAEYVDASLKLVFDTPPSLGGGTIRVFRKLDNALVDVIRLSGETDSLGYVGQDQVRKVNTTPIKISGNTVTIKPHANALDYNTEYYVAIANGVFTGTSLGGVPFVGIGKLADWSFTTKAAAPTAASVTVDDDGAADFRTVQGALTYAMKTFGKAQPVTITVKNGAYEELLFLRNKDNVSIVGESRDGVVIKYSNYDTLNTGSGASQTASASAAAAGGRAVMLVETADMLSLDTLTLQNTTLRSSAISAQAETIYFNSDAGRLVAKNATFLSEQDTVQLRGYAWFYRSPVAGNVDFIWGGARAALFEESEIRSLGDTTSATSGGYVLQARVANATDKGFVFLNSSLTHGVGPGPLHGDVPAGATWLARSPGGTATWDNVAFVNCKMDAHVQTAGWAGTNAGQPAPNPAAATAASGWREYGSTDLAGNPLNLAARIGGFALSASDVSVGFATRAKVFAAFNANAGWNPQP